MEQQQRKASGTKTIRSQILGGLTALLGAAVGGFFLYVGIAWFGLKPILLHEYGEPLPPPEAFGKRAVGYVEAPTKPILGFNRVQLTEADGAQRTAWLWVRDTKAPRATGLERTISTKVVLQPDELIDGLSDADQVRVSFASEPPFGTVGDYPVTVFLEDTSGNRSSVTAALHIRVTSDGLTVEAGSEAPDVRAFLVDDYAVESVAGLDETVLRTPGEHPITITVDGMNYVTALTVIDTIPPKAETKTVLAAPGTEVKPADFLENLCDGSDVTAEFLNEPNPDERSFQSIGIRLTDAGGNTTDLTAGLLFTIATPLTVEARSKALTAEECLPAGSYTEAAMIAPFVPNRIGTYAVALMADGERQIALVDVVDTVPPTLIAEDTTWYLDHPVDPTAFCRELSDVTGVTLTSATEIDWTKAGEQPVTLTATDGAGNTASVSFKLTLVRDTEPPKLYGVRSQSVYFDEPVAYLAEVFAADAVDGETEVTVDASLVDRNQPGVYPVTYTSVDRSGNVATQTVRFTFIRAGVSEADLKAKAQEIVDSVTTPEMTRTERLVALYDYVYDHVRYTGHSDKSDWRKEALRGFRYGTGDCFTFYTTLRALLDETDIPYMSVTRKGGYTRHYWLIVNVGTGWYHLDANHNGTANWRCFMWTNSQCSSPVGFWNYEQSIYPPIATEPFLVDAVIAAEKAEQTP